MNINMLRDADNDAGFYAAACALDPDAVWRGAALYRSLDGGSTYASLATIPEEATIGYTTNALGDFHSGNIPDELNSIRVVLANGNDTLSSTTYAGMLAGVNACVLGREIIYFRDATQEAVDTYVLTGLLRGRRGTEYAMAEHAIQDRFVLVSTATMVRVPQTTADIGLERYYKGVGIGRTVAGTPAETFTNEGAGLKPYAPVQLGGGRNAAGDITLNWVRRGRIAGEWRDNVDVPLGETSEAYEVVIYTDGTYATVKRTITGITSQTTTYLAATQTTDFGSPQATVYFKVYQLSETVGRGFAGTGSV